MWYSSLGKTFISRHIPPQHWHTCPIALPVRRNPQHRSLLTVVSATSAPGWASSAIFERHWENFSTTCDPLYATNTSHRKQETLLYEYPLHWVLLPTKKDNRMLFFGITFLMHSRYFDYWNHVHACLLPRLSWSWTMLLPSDTYRKHITSITAVLLPFVTYLLTLLHKIQDHNASIRADEEFTPQCCYSSSSSLTCTNLDFLFRLLGYVPW
jgi:hypothetical protein